MKKNNTSIRNRIAYIDAMRGFLILTVVFVHIFDHALFEEGVFATRTWIIDLICVFFLPLFFFISGLFAHKSMPHTIMRGLIEKSRCILLPTIITWAIFNLSTDYNLYDGLNDPFKNGYWFTYALFEIYLIYTFLDYILYRFGIKKKTCVYISLIVAFYIIQSLLFRLKYEIYSQDWFRIIGIQQILKYTGFFLFGVWVKNNQDKFLKLMNSQIVMSTFLIFSVVLFSQFRNMPILSFMNSFLMIILIYKIFYSYQSFFECNNYVAKCLNLIGRRTMAIYFLHYFFLNGIMELHSTEFTELLQNNWLIQILVGSAFTILLTAASLLLEKVARSFPAIYKLALGQIKK